MGIKLEEQDLSKLSPMMQHYLQTKKEYPGCILFYRLGDFYEMFFEDAEIVSRELELTLTGNNGLKNNMSAVKQAKSLGKPVVTCIIAGRHLFLGKSYYDTWDSVVMCYLPGSEGKGISNVLCGFSDFTGRLPSPWYNFPKQILGLEDSMFEKGYGLSYGDDFVPRTKTA